MKCCRSSAMSPRIDITIPHDSCGTCKDIIYNVGGNKCCIQMTSIFEVQQWVLVYWTICDWLYWTTGPI